MTMPKAYTEAYEVGHARGWEHANHAEHVEGRTIADVEAEADAAEVPLSYAEGDARSGWRTGYRDGIDKYAQDQDADDDIDPDDYHGPHSDAVAAALARDEARSMTNAQRGALTALSERYGVEFRAEWFAPAFDLPSGYVAGWIGGPARRLYVGCDPHGLISS